MNGNWAWPVFLEPYIAQGGHIDIWGARSANAFSDCLMLAEHEHRLNEHEKWITSQKGQLHDVWIGYRFPTFEKFKEMVDASLRDLWPFHHCPSDFRSDRGELHRSGLTDSSGNRVPVVSGARWLEFGAATYVAANSSRQCYALVAGQPNGETLEKPPDGAFDGLRGRKLKEFVDGQANSVLLSERIAGSLNPRRERQLFGRLIPAGGATHIGCRGIGRSDIDGSKTNDPADAWGAPDVLFSAWGGINVRDEARPWRKFQGVSSRHPGGVNMALADGSVRFIAETTVVSASDPNPSAPWTSDAAPADVWRSLIALTDASGAEDPSR